MCLRNAVQCEECLLISMEQTHHVALNYAPLNFIDINPHHKAVAKLDSTIFSSIIPRASAISRVNQKPMISSVTYRFDYVWLVFVEEQEHENLPFGCFVQAVYLKKYINYNRQFFRQ